MVVGSVVKAIAILRYLAGSKPQGVNAIARAVAISPSSCFGILKTLVAEAFLDFDAVTKTYRIGTFPAQLFGTSVGKEEWLDWLDERLRDLAGKFCVCMGLWQRRSDRVELLRVADSPLDTRLHLSVGQRLPSHVGAMGRCIAARERNSPQELKAIVKGIRWRAPPSIKEYAHAVRAAARSGWAVDEGNYLCGVTSVATVITDAEGAVRFCLTASTFSGQFDREAIARIGAELNRLGRAAEARLAQTTRARSVARPAARNVDRARLAPLGG